MTINEIKALITDKTGMKCKSKKMYGAMKDYTCFRVTEGKIPDAKAQEIKALFPAINGKGGTFIDWYEINIHNQNISHATA